MNRAMRMGALLPMTALALVACSEATLPGPPTPPPPPFTLELLEASEHFVQPTKLVALNLIINRESGFAEPITFRSENPPEIVVQFNPGVVMGGRTDVSIVASVEALKTRHEIGLIGRSQGGAEQKLIVELTVE